MVNSVKLFMYTNYIIMFSISYYNYNLYCYCLYNYYNVLNESCTFYFINKIIVTLIKEQYKIIVIIIIFYKKKNMNNGIEMGYLYLLISTPYIFFWLGHTFMYTFLFLYFIFIYLFRDINFYNLLGYLIFHFWNNPLKKETSV